jgi:cation diffusion facilitator CzcD-associated flavoprotein CzcO
MTRETSSKPQGPKNEHIVIVGTGFSGLGMAIRLKQSGIHDFTILERASGIGGTWRANHYPGAACDVESNLYSFSFEPNPTWSRTFAPQKEILAYLERCVEKYGLAPHIRLDSGVESARWDEATEEWIIVTAKGETLRARVLVSGSGGLTKPVRPDIPGLDSFAGKTFHSAEWDDACDLDGKRVAVIGTGASAIQIVPEVAKRAAHLAVFQRTAPWIMPKADRPFTDAERARFESFPLSQKLSRAAIYTRNEIMALGFLGNKTLMRLGEAQALKYLHRVVPDAELRKKLTPTFRLGCKRVLLTNDYYPAIQRKNVELVTDPIDRIEADGVLTKSGVKHAVDTLVLATGFVAAEQTAPFDLYGKGGRHLNDAWKDGCEAYLGTTVAGFPNFFIVFGPNTALGHSSMVYMIESQIAYVLDAIKTMRARGWRAVDVKPSVLRAYNDELQTRFGDTVWSSGCASWYRTKSGRNTTLWPSFTFEFRYKTRKFDADKYDVVSEGAVGQRQSPMTQAPGVASRSDVHA